MFDVLKAFPFKIKVFSVLQSGDRSVITDVSDHCIVFTLRLNMR